MKVKKKGISSILGALIFLQILLISLILVIHVIDNETNTTLKSLHRVQALSEYAPISETVENNVTYLYSTSTFTITHVVYPNGEIVNASISVDDKYPVSQILNGSPWAIVITSQGTWYNVSLLGGGNGDPSIITFPNYHDYGTPLNNTIFLLGNTQMVSSYINTVLGNVSETPNWQALDGIGSPSPFSLVPVNVTVGDPTTYHWALTFTELAVYPLSADGWINITAYSPFSLKCTYEGAHLSSFWFKSNVTLGIYVPINVTTTLGVSTVPDIFPKFIYYGNASNIAYAYIYTTAYETTNYTSFNHFHEDYSSIYSQIGTSSWDLYSTPYCFTAFPTKTLQSFTNNTNVFSFSPPFCDLPLPPYNVFKNSVNWSKLITPVNHQFGECIQVPYHYFPLNVYQVDINLHKGEVLTYGYDSLKNSWLLIENYTYKYNDPELYTQLAEQDEETGYAWAIPNGHGGYTFVNPRTYIGTQPVYNAYLTNIANIEYLTEFPVYIVIPQGTYVLQVSLS